MSRGIKHERDMFITTLQSQLFSWKRKNLNTGNDEVIALQGSLRPIELWEYVFPEESLPQVLAMLGISEKKGTPNAANINKALRAKAAVLRKMLGAKKIPKLPEVERAHFIYMNGMSIHPIGIREDKRGEIEDVVTKQKYFQELV